MATATNINGWNVGGNNNSFDQRGHFYRGVFSGNVSGMLVKQNSTPNMTVLVEHGSALLNKNTTSASIAEIKSDTSVTIDTANTSNPRIDTVVIYEDTSIAIPSAENDYWQDGAGGRFKVVSLPGIAAAAPVALTDASIQSAIGAGKPWTRLADITVPANSTTILDSNIADRREQLGGTIQYGGGYLNPGDNYKTFTPASNGLLTVFANGRRNTSTAADLTLRISATGTSAPLDAFGVGYGNADGHTTAYYLATVSKGTPVTIKISVGGGNISQGAYRFSVTPGATMFV